MTRRAHRSAHGRPLPDGPAPFTTLVELTFEKRKVEHWIRFGRKSYEQIIDRRRSVVGFTPGSVFAFVRWAKGEHGTVVSRIDIVRAIGRGEPFQTLPFVRPGGSVVDVGCHEGAFFDAARDRVSSGIGVDVHEPERWVGDPFELHVGRLPDLVDDGRTFDAIVALAVVEHLSRDELQAWSEAVPALLAPGGRLVITTPSPAVDRLLDLLITLRLLDREIIE